MVICSAVGCRSRSDRKEPGITFHRFPITDPEKTRSWVQNMHRAEWFPTKNDRLCSKHFERCFFFMSGERTCLLNKAIPTIFLELPKYLQVQPKKARKRSLQETEARTEVPVAEPVAGPSGVQRSVTLDDTPRKKKLKRQLFEEIRKSKVKSRKIKVLGQKLKRCKKRIISLKQVLKDLKAKNLLNSENSLLFESFPEISKQLQLRKLKKRTKYSPELRQFAITLCFFSPKAYDYVRSTFDTCLPHRSTIGKWFKNVEAEPGFTSESFDTLKKYVVLSERPTLLALVVDEISIRKQIEWDGKKFHGYVNFGFELQDDSNAVAKEAFVIMGVCVNGSWKLPLGYFFTDGLSGEQKSTLVTQCIKLISETGAQVISLTFDGAPSNITMTHILGCKTSLPQMKTSFSIDDSDMSIFFDPSHMLKLVRNTLGEKKILVDGNGEYIKWEYLEKLVKLQDTEGLHLGNKLRKAHLNFFKQKMKVKLAVQLLSESVADALNYCEDELELNEFQGSRATANFIRIFNNIFDILNSRSLRPPGYKKAICEQNIDRTRLFINEAITYISSLKFENGELLINSRKKTGFLGFIVGLKSSLDLYEKIILQKKMLIYFPFYKISQDHLELFFSSIRSKGGWNNNPTSRQFTSAYKRLLVRAEIREGGVGNCIPLDDIPILVGSSRLKVSELNIGSNRLSLTEVTESSPLQSILGDHDYIMNTSVVSECSQQIVIYIAGFVVRQLEKTIRCEHCLGALHGEKEKFLNSLIAKKNKGGLTYPSSDVIKICKLTEHYLRINENSLNKNNFIYTLKSKIMFECLQNEYFDSIKPHILETSSNHIYFLIEAVISKFLNIRLHFISKRRSEVVDPIRSQFTKLILFKGQ